MSKTCFEDHQKRILRVADYGSYFDNKDSSTTASSSDLGRIREQRRISAVYDFSTEINCSQNTFCFLSFVVYDYNN